MKGFQVPVDTQDINRVISLKIQAGLQEYITAEYGAKNNVLKLAKKYLDNKFRAHEQAFLSLNLKHHLCPQCVSLHLIQTLSLTHTQNTKDDCKLEIVRFNYGI